MDAADELPHIDEHEIVVEAAPDEVWRALHQVIDDAFGSGVAAAYARLIGCDPPNGFEVVEAEPPRLLVLRGRHHFSVYAIVFRLDPVGDASRLRAESRATFPGPHGRLYRLLVISSGFHARAVRRMLGSVRRRAS